MSATWLIIMREHDSYLADSSSSLTGKELPYSVCPLVRNVCHMADDYEGTYLADCSSSLTGKELPYPVCPLVRSVCYMVVDYEGAWLLPGRLFFLFDWERIDLPSRPLVRNVHATWLMIMREHTWQIVLPLWLGKHKSLSLPPSLF